jgi:preprotein translocase subunit SecG
MILEHTDNAKATCVFLTKLVLMQRYDTDQLGSEVDTDDNDDGRDDNGMMLKMLMVMVMMTTAFAENGDVDQNINNRAS